MAKQSKAKSKTASSTKRQSKTKNTKTSLDKPKKTQNPPKVLVMLGVVVLVLLGFWGYKQVLIYQEKQQFEKSKKQLLAIASDIKNTYVNSEVMAADSCQYTSEKFTKGSLSCDISAELKLTGLTDDAKNKLVEDTRDTLRKYPTSYTVTKQINFPMTEEYERYNFNSESFKFTKPSSTLSCYVTYSDNPKLSSDANDDGTYVFISCYGAAKAEHYPLNN